ncbi:MAG TPA: N-acetylmuramoyl-L-alanine amidase, partial [Steroidobacteraceae bacterium]|nr:N-acetylmuramoyl-L-alanine amidase [Steroidobacteraceae bacterium]
MKGLVLKGRALKGLLAWAAALLALLPVVALAAASTTQLRGISVTAADGSARITLDTSRVTSHNIFTLDRPNRIVVDLRNTRVAGTLRTPAGSGIVESIRTGVRPKGTLRVVIQLRSPIKVRGGWLAPSGDAGNRLVVSLGAPMTSPAVATVKATPPATVTSATITSTAVVSPASTSPAVANEGSSPRQVRAAHAPTDGDRDIIIAVDAGHGGQDPGAIGRSGTREKDVVLAIAKALAVRINSEPGMRAVLTRDNDTFVVLRDRMHRARLAKADLFVSVHADSIRDRNISGASVYVLSDRGATSEAARWLAERENSADLMGGVKLDDKDNALASVLIDLSQTASLSASMTAAERVLSSLDGVSEVRKSSVQQAGFVVLKSPDIPSMLVETAYISNPSEEGRLRT